MLRTLSYTGVLASTAIGIAAIGGSDENRQDLLNTSGLVAASSAVAALISLENNREKYRPIVDIEKHVALRKRDLKDHTKATLANLDQVEEDIVDKLNERNSLTSEIDQLNTRLRQEKKAFDSEQSTLNESLSDLRQKIAEVRSETEDELDISDAGFDVRRYIGVDSAQLLEKLKLNREKQKEIAKKLLDECKNSQVTLENSSSKGRALVRQTLKALLRGFNGECDAAISTLKHSNDSTVNGKIEKAFAFYQLQAEQRIPIPWSDELYVLKDDEAHLVHENALAKHTEREEQAELRRQEREEAQARREAEEAERKAEHEREMYVEMLRKAKEAAAEDDQSEEYLIRIAELEKKVKEAEENKKRAISLAEITRSGHVYIISNIGSFGHNVFKVGMTRRLEPTDRVRELGDASVPFPFDIHAMIYTEDAPGLENAIHKRIDSQRLNLVNLRREFFTISWDQLIVEAEAAACDIGVTAEIRWSKVAEAEQYRQSVSERQGTEQSPRYFADGISSSSPAALTPPMPTGPDIYSA